MNLAPSYDHLQHWCLCPNSCHRSVSRCSSRSLLPFRKVLWPAEHPHGVSSIHVMRSPIINVTLPHLCMFVNSLHTVRTPLLPSSKIQWQHFNDAAACRTSTPQAKLLVFPSSLFETQQGKIETLLPPLAHHPHRRSPSPPTVSLSPLESELVFVLAQGKSQGCHPDAVFARPVLRLMTPEMEAMKRASAARTAHAAHPPTSAVEALPNLPVQEHPPPPPPPQGSLSPTGKRDLASERH